MNEMIANDPHAEIMWQEFDIIEQNSASGMGGASAGMFAFGATVAAFQTIGAGVAYHFQSETLDIQRDTKIAAYDHQERMGEKQKNMQLTTLKEQKKQQQNAKVANQKYLDAQQKLARAKGEKTISEADLKEARLTMKAGKTDGRALDKLFDRRGNYRYGNPIAHGTG